MCLLCDASGTVVFADERARTLVGAREGRPLERCAPPGAEEKIRQLIARARQGEVEHWEVALLAGGEPVTCAFSGGPREGGVALVGNLAPSAYGGALERVASTMAELADLHRRSERQQRELERRNEELVRLNRELDDAGRGVVALHAELDEKADTLHRADQVKSHVIAHVSHEFRTPINAILSMAGLLLDRIDGELTPEQERQLGFIRTSAEALSILTNDMLDLSRAEIGKLQLRIAPFEAGRLLGAVRGMLKPLHARDEVRLEFEPAEGVPPLETDEPKVAQVVRNLVTNALKFTERGEVRVRAARGPGDTVSFAVTDTGMGIAPEDQQRIFEEFVQVDNPLQGRVKGTGLGLSLSRALADLLGGTLTVASSPGRGSTFTLTVPRVHPDATEMRELAERAERPDPLRTPVLVVEDDRQTLVLYEKYLSGAGYQVIPVRSVDEARHALGRVRPAAIVLDVVLEGESTWGFLAELKEHPDYRHIPTLVVTVTDREQRARALGADEFFVKPLDRDWLLRKLAAYAKHGPVETVLIVDDEEAARYLVKKHLQGLPYRVLEAASGAEGVRLARAERPQAIFLDFVMPGMSAFEVIDELKRDPATRCIPVIVNTSKELAEDERRRLAEETAAILSKQSLSREVAMGRIREALGKAGVRPGAGG
jgi:signal transduction histidine kinase/CheY-like chemotaxis protein